MESVRDEYHTTGAGRVISLLRAPIRQDTETDIDNQPIRAYPSNKPAYEEGSHVFNRSLSQPSERSNDFNMERVNRERNLLFNRSFSQPRSSSADYFDTNNAIHNELINNPWGTYRRTPKKRDRYAIYIPDPDKCETEYPCYDREGHLRAGRRRQHEEMESWNNSEHTGNMYATYPRAPRTYPRVCADMRSSIGDHLDHMTRDTRRDGVVFSNLRKIPNDINHTENNLTMNQIKHHEGVKQHPTVQHLFSIPLNDVKQLNTAHSTPNGVNGKLKNVKNNVSEKSIAKGIISNISRKRTKDCINSIVGDESQHSCQKKPFFYCRWVAEYPKTCFLLTLGGHVLVAVVTVMMLLSGYDLFPTEFEYLPMYDFNVPWMKRDFAWRFRHEYKARYVRKWYIQGLNKWYRSMAYDRANIELFYDTGGGNIFTKEHLKLIAAIENELANMNNYSDYCVQTILLKCQKPTSVLRYFDGTYVNIDSVFNDTEYKNIAKVLYTARTHNETKGDFAYFLSQDHHMTNNHAYASKTRTRFLMGFPIKLEQEREAMEDEMEDFLVKHFKPTVEMLMENTSDFKLIYWSFLLFKHDIVVQIFYDLILAIGSVLFIFGFIVYHTKSLWISTFSVTSILTSFLCTNIIYRVFLDYRYFGFFHVITLFIILGIGADDLFVFLDVWKITGFETYPSLAHRLSSAYKNSMKSMFFTSLTTTVAFFVSAFSPLLATQSFGVFAGLLVIVNYMSVVIYFPTVVILHHLYFKTWTWSCLSNSVHNYKCKMFQKKNNNSTDKEHNFSTIQCIFDDNSVIGTAGNRYNVLGKVNPAFKHEIDDEYGFVTFKSMTSDSHEASGEAKLEKLSNESNEASNLNMSWSTTDEQKQKKVLVRFFRDYYFYFVTHWLMKWMLLIILTTLVTFFAYCISRMETENEPAQFYRNSHNYGKALDLDFHEFVANKNDRNVVVYIVWGLKERDMSACHFSDPRCFGQEKFDTSFNPNSERAQIALKNFCDKLLNFDDRDIEHFKIRRDFSTGQPEIKCFASDLDKSMKAESLRTGLNLTLPWNYRKAISFMQSKSLMYNTMKFNSSFPNVFEIPISYWLNDGYRFQNKNNFEKFHALIGEGTSSYSTPMKTDFSVFYGNRITYLGVQVNLTLGKFSSGYPEGKPVMDRWEAYVQHEVSRMPPEMRNGFQLTKDYWHSLSVQKTIEDSAIMGIVVGILLAFPILTIATNNIFIGFFATLSICCSTICVVGTIPITGCKLGILESLNMCMVVGLTVDYVVHLAEGYHMSKHIDRKSRVRDMLEVMGISVFSGACTTLGASIFMFFAEIQFIIRFGMFMFSTIGFSLLYSLCFFTTIMGLVGPSGESGDVKIILRKIIQKCRNLFQK